MGTEGLSFNPSVPFAVASVSAFEPFDEGVLIRFARLDVVDQDTVVAHPIGKGPQIR